MSILGWSKMTRSEKPSGAGVRRHLGWIAFCVVAALPACLGSIGVKEKHAAFHGCSSGKVELEELLNEGHTKFKSQGCGHEEVYYCIVGKCISPRILSVRHHAAKHDCKVQEIATQEPTPNEFVTNGCGKTDRYRCREVPDDVVQCDAVP